MVEVPEWIQEQQASWGESLVLPEWEDKDEYRSRNGWKVRASQPAQIFGRV